RLAAARAAGGGDGGFPRGPERFRLEQLPVTVPLSINEMMAAECTLAIGEAEAIGDGDPGVEARRMHPVAAEIEGDARRQLLGIAAPADAVRRLQRHHLEAELARGARRRQSGGAGADDGEIVGHARDATCFSATRFPATRFPIIRFSPLHVSL